MNISLFKNTNIRKKSKVPLLLGPNKENKKKYLKLINILILKINSWPAGVPAEGVVKRCAAPLE